MEIKEEQQDQLFLSPAGPTVIINSTQESHQYDQQVYVSHSNGSADHKLFQHVHRVSSCKREVGDHEGSSTDTSIKLMPSKMRSDMQKMTNSNCSETDKPVRFTMRLQDHNSHTNASKSYINNNTTIRVCSDCNTTTTPLWRSGPRGPKSLCNACGIRQRKARRAMAAAAAAANGTPIAMETPFAKNKVVKEKKSRTSQVVQCKKLCQLPQDVPPAQSQKKLCFKNFALSLNKNSDLQRVFPQDVEEAAVLLMELSCGFIHSRYS